MWSVVESLRRMIESYPTKHELAAMADVLTARYAQAKGPEAFASPDQIPALAEGYDVRMMPEEGLQALFAAVAGENVMNRVNLLMCSRRELCSKKKTCPDTCF